MTTSTTRGSPSGRWIGAGGSSSRRTTTCMTRCWTGATRPTCKRSFHWSREAGCQPGCGTVPIDLLGCFQRTP
eukprot:1446503-Lingulodinium_polyedra.AAC.1